MNGMRVVLACLCLGFVALFCCAQESNVNLIDDVPSPGALNAIKRAYQMTDLCFTPLDSFVANPTKTYYMGQKCQGLVYSSVKEMHTFVGVDVSFHTFMTALHNPRSVMYTENVSKPPYHGLNCGAYYGTVCSGLVSYALGFKVYQKSCDIKKIDAMQFVADQSVRGIQLGDVLWSKGHVALITGIKRDVRDGRAVEIEICEGVRPGCRRKIVTGKELDKMLSKGKNKVYRYRYLEKVDYAPLTDFVAVGDELIEPYKYNDDICTSRGDKACYVVGDNVVLNIAKGYKELEIYKESVLYRKMKIGNDLDITINELPYGSYKARVVNNQKKSDYTYWMVVDLNVETDRNDKNVHFHSSNSIPVYLEFCSARGGGRSTRGIFELTEEDKEKEYVKVDRYIDELGKKSKYKYVRVHFECEYGRVTNLPVNWFE